MEYFIDLHCHSTLRPFGNSFSKKDITNPESKSCIWYYDKPVLIDKLIDITTSLAQYSQADFTSATKGKVFLLGVSLYSPEVEFFKNKLGDGNFDKWVENAITNYSEERIEEINSDNYRYFTDLQSQYNFLLELNNKTILHKNTKYKYLLINKITDLSKILAKPNEITIAVFINIEGGHSLGSGQPNFTNSAEQILKNAETIKNWEFKPFYLTLTHHFKNDLAGHCRSLPDAINFLASQEPEINEPITPLGFKVIEKLLDNTNNKRILIDIKHLSTQGRKQFYNLLKTNYATENIPIIFSHGGLNGLKTFADAWQEIPDNKFNNWDINLFEEEIPIIAKSGGIIGLNLDQRVMSSKAELKKAKGNISKFKMKFKFSKLIWNHIERIAEILNENNLPAWNLTALGSDFDGLINPINGFWTLEYLTELETFLNMHAFNYLKTANLNAENKISSEKIISNFMYKNANNFLLQNMK
jgi:microsomal dipeptidase-like Zn-dependent dipeptidase